MKTSKGFTLTELLIVVLIIAILAAIAVPNFLMMQVRAKVSRAQADMRVISIALEAYAVEWGRYPNDFDAGVYGGNTPPGEWETYKVLSTPVAYLSTTPKDPFSGGEDKPLSYYDYWGYDVIEVIGPSAFLSQLWERHNVRWMVNSFGPDRVTQSLPINLDFVIYIYDPSNGTVSSGDIGRNNNGVVR